MHRTYARKPLRNGWPSRADLVGLEWRLRQVEQEAARLRLNQVTAKEFAWILRGASLPPEVKEPDDLIEQRLIALLDILFAEAGPRREGDLSWSRFYFELRETLAGLGLKPVTPEGRFDRALCQAVEVVPAENEEDHLVIKKVLRPAVVRVTAQGRDVVRHAAVVVSDLRVSVNHTASVSETQDKEDER